MNKEKLIFDAIQNKAWKINRTARPVYGQGQYDMAYEILNEVSKITQSETEETCTYLKWDDDSNAWECSECGEVWMLNADSPKENNMNYCPNCGKKIIEKAGE